MVGSQRPTEPVTAASTAATTAQVGMGHTAWCIEPLSVCALLDGLVRPNKRGCNLLLHVQASQKYCMPVDHRIAKHSRQSR
jgi:hypothetical protein